MRMFFHKNELVDVGKGVFRFGLVQRSETSDIILLVHPTTMNGTYETDPSYVRRREDLIHYSTNTILILVGEEDFEYFTRKYRKMGFRGNRFIILTQQYNPAPRKMSWWQFTDWIKTTLRPRKIVVCGAELHLDKTNTPYAGCVLEAAHRLSGLAIVEIDRSCCWME